MFEVNRNLSVDPASINEFVIAHREIALILRINHCCIASLVNTSESVIIPYLIISHAALPINVTLRH